MDSLTGKTDLLNSDEINFILLVKRIWKEKNRLIKTVLIFSCIGLVIAFTSPKEFTTTTIMVPSGSNFNLDMNGLSGLAAMAGLEIGTDVGNEISPIIYPKILNSMPFQLELIKTPLSFSNHAKKITFDQFSQENSEDNPVIKYTIGLPGLILSLPLKLIANLSKNKSLTTSEADSSIIALTASEQSAILELSDKVSLDIDKKEGLITLTATMPEPKAAAELGLSAQQLLQTYVTKIQIKKAQANYSFIQQRFDEASNQLEQSQNLLATFNDRNRNVSSSVAKVEFEKLNRAFNLKYDIYSELAKQLEQAKIKVKQDTPVFTVIEPVSIPLKKSHPNRPLILFVWICFGILVGIGQITLYKYWKFIKETWISL